MRFLTLLIALVTAAGGCTSRTYTDPPFVLDVAGPVAIDVDIFAGDVHVQASPGLKHAIVTITRESTHGNLRGDEAVRSLEQLGFKAEVVPGEIGQVLQIRAMTEHEEPHFQQVNVEVRVPDIEGLTVRTVNGNVKALDVQGPVDVSTNDGNVLIATNHPLHASVRVVNARGDIDMRVRGASTGALDFEAVDGRVRHTIRRGQTIVHPGTDHDSLLASLNEGSNPIVLRTLEGDIRFRVVKSPHRYFAIEW